MILKIRVIFLMSFNLSPAWMTQSDFLDDTAKVVAFDHLPPKAPAFSTVQLYLS